MARTSRHVVRTWPADHDVPDSIMQPREDVVLEVAVEPEVGELARFEQREGPFGGYRRSVIRDQSTRVVTERTTYRLDVPWFGWLFGPLVRRQLRRPERSDPVWAPPDRLTTRQVNVLGLLAAASLLSAFSNTLFTQTVAYAGDDFGVGDWGRGVGGMIVRLGIILGLPAALVADRIGRRRVVVFLAWTAPIVAALGSLAPNFAALVSTQAVSRPLGLALDLLVAVIAAEEMPRNSRAYAVSILAMANGLGAGVAVILLPLADVGDSGWRVIYAMSLVWLVVAVDLTRRLPETERVLVRRADTRAAVPMQRRRLAVQMSVSFFGNLLLAPASFFQNGYLKDERGFSAAMVAVFTLVTSTPAVIGLVVGGRVADQRGRRRLAVTCVPIGAVLIASSFFFSGPLLWMAAISGAVVAATAYPSLAVYRTEMFPTGRRGRAAFLILASALVGGSLSLLLVGALLDRDVAHGPVMMSLVIGPAIVAAIVWRTYPETAHRELEDINPEDTTRSS
ncbi:MAG: MFS transporter [Actinomycetota bacterium]